MRLWQGIMIYLARNSGLKGFMQGGAATARLAASFVGGENSLEAVRRSETLRGQGRTTSLFYLGEYVEDESVVARTISELKSAINLLALSNLDVHISVDPTQIGYQINERICRDNAFEIADSIRRAPSHASGSRNVLMLDMEDSRVTEPTLRLYRELKEAGLPVAVTLQAYLLRSDNDLRSVLTGGGALRLVKGAFAERGAGALRKRTAIDRNYLRLADVMLSAEAQASGFYPIFGTHDAHLIDEIVRLASRRGWKREQYEFEMLYGVQVELQERLVREGRQLRLYLPFGTDWWPYAARRIGESPRNAKLLLRSIAASPR